MAGGLLVEPAADRVDQVVDEVARRVDGIAWRGLGRGGAERLVALGAQDEVAEGLGRPLAAGLRREQVDLWRGLLVIGEVSPRASRGRRR